MHEEKLTLSHKISVMNTDIYVFTVVIHTNTQSISHYKQTRLGSN